MTLIGWILTALQAFTRRSAADETAERVKQPVRPVKSPVQDVKTETDEVNMNYPPAFLSAVNYVLDHERGYVNNLKDPGGPTNMGITWKTLARWRDVHRNTITPNDVKQITREEAVEIYKAMYWDAVRADKLPPALAYAAFDFAVNSGPLRAVKEIQKLIGTVADGIIGGHTLRRLAAVDDTEELVNRYCDARLAFMKKAKHPKTKARLWPTFKNGWSKRVADVRRRSLRHVPNGGGGW